MKLEKIPTAPPYVKENKIINSIYREVCKDLIERGVLRKVDIAFVAAYACALYTYQDITIRLIDPENEKEDIIYRDHNKQIRQHPLTRVQSKNLEALKTLSSMLGITPLFRGKIRVGEEGSKQKPKLRRLGKAL